MRESSHLPLYVLSGIGGDARLFDAQRAVREIRPIAWIAPEGRETLAHYAQRLAHELHIDEPFDLGGASFGGMAALEVARHLAPENVFLFGSCRSPRSVSPMLRRLPLIEPPRIGLPLIARWMGATKREHVKIFEEMFEATPIEFVRWAAQAVFSWEGVDELPMPVHHIHGDHDRVIPIRGVNADRVVEGAGHLLTLTHAAVVNEFIASTARRNR